MLLPPRFPRRAACISIAFAAALVILAGPARARADDLPCSPTVLAWVARADAALRAKGTSVVAAACPPGRARLRLSPQGGAPLDVEVAEPPGPAFRHAGRLRVSPILEVADFQDMPAREREAFEALYTWLVASASAIEVTPPPIARAGPPRLAEEPVKTAGNAAPLLGFALVLAALGVCLGRTRPEHRSSLRLALGLLFGALALRLAFGPFGPHHANGQGPAWILAAAEDPTMLAPYGPGYPELFSGLARLFPARVDVAIFAANAALSAAAAPLTFLLGLGLGLAPRRAFVAAALLAVDPVSIRVGATESYFPAIITLLLAASVCLVAAGARARGAAAASMLAVAGTIFATLATRIHPIAWGPVALAPGFVLAASLAERRSSARALAAALAATFVLGLAFVLANRTWLPLVTSQAGDHWTLGDALAALRGAAVARPAVIVLTLGSIFFMARPRAVLLPALAAAAALVATRGAYGQGELWQSSYDRLWIQAPLLALAALVPPSLARARFAPAALAVSLVVILGAGRKTVTERTTEQREHVFFRDKLASLPPTCRVAYVQRVGRRIVYLPEYALGLRGGGPRRAVVVDDAEDALALLAGGGCLRYARTSLCTSVEGRPICERVERALTLVVMERAALPARPSHEALPYDRDPVEIVLYDVRGPSGP